MRVSLSSPGRVGSKVRVLVIYEHENQEVDERQRQHHQQQQRGEVGGGNGANNNVIGSNSSSNINAPKSHYSTSPSMFGDNQSSASSPSLISPTLTYSSQTPSTLSLATPFFGSFNSQTEGFEKGAGLDPPSQKKYPLACSTACSRHHGGKSRLAPFPKGYALPHLSCLYDHGRLQPPAGTLGPDGTRLRALEPPPCPSPH
jgi:hypothetical protein